MRQQLIGFLIALLPLAVALPAEGTQKTPGSLTLDQALELAREHNPELRALEFAHDAAQWKQSEALAAYVPHVDLRASHLLGADYSRLRVVFGGAAIVFPEAFPQTEADLTVSWMIFDGFGAWGGYRARGLEAEASDLEAQQALARLQQSVKVRFIKALAAQQLVTVAEQNITTLEQHASLADASERAGFATRVDVLRIGSQLEEARAEELLAQDNAALARRDLAQVLGQDPDDRPLEGELPIPDAAKVPTTLEFDLSQRADTLALRRKEEALERLQSASSAGIWAPKVALFGTEQFYKFGDFDPAILPNDSFQSAYSYGLKASWNLFSGGSDWARYQQARDTVSQMLESQHRLSLSSADEFEAAKRHYHYNAALYLARLRSVEKSQESVRLATLSVKAGAQTHSQALDAELDLFHAKAGVIQAQLGAAEALAALEQALGHPL